MELFTPLYSAENNDPKKTELKKEELKEELSETTHSIKIDGTDIHYKARIGNLVLKDEEGAAKANIFFTSYTKEGQEPSNERPITFCFNGGPGASSIWLHMGGLGPKRVELTEKGCAPLHHQLIDNEYSILDDTDLVFIDPVSTGYSRSAPGEDTKQFHGVDEDIRSVAEFIRLYITNYNRWNSPKFLAGESYGTTRAAGLAGFLHDEYFIYTNGIMLISSVLDFISIDFCAGNDLPYMLFLPTYTATAWYYNKLPADLQANFQQALKESQSFAMNDYALALLKGNKISSAEKNKIIQQLVRYTGLSYDYIARSHLRISNKRFVKELLRNSERTVGRFDSRYQGIDADAAGESFEYDPSLDVIAGAFTACFNQYVRTDLKWEKNEHYKILANVWPWNFGEKATNKHLNVACVLREVMTKNPYLKVFIASGYYDLATPYFATDYTFDHLGLDPSLNNHITMEYYKAGHMMYIHQPSLVKLKQDLKSFIKKTLDCKEKE